MLFDQDRRGQNEKSRKFYATVEIGYTCVDFSAALCFVVGSVLFLGERLHTMATWFFIVGSILFALKPTIRTLREIELATMGDDHSLAQRKERSV